MALELATTPDPVADLAGDWAARRSPAFNVAVARCAGTGAGAGAGGATIDDLVVTGVRGVATFDDDVAGADAVAVAEGVAASEAFVVTPRSRSPMLGRSFICSPQYYKGVVKRISKAKKSQRPRGALQGKHLGNVSAFDSSHDYGLQGYVYLVPYSSQTP